jgi:hypothetical protein
VIGLGVALAGAGRFVSDPKLWAKVLVIAVWFVSTHVLRRLGSAQHPKGNKRVMLVTCSIVSVVSPARRVLLDGAVRGMAIVSDAGGV